MPTTINSVTFSSSDPKLPAVSGVTPSSASDGRYTWSVVEQSADGSQIVLKANGPGTVSGYTANGNTVTTNMATAVSGSISFVTLRVTYSGTSNAENWTVNAGASGQMVQTFKKGNGGGSARKKGARNTRTAAV